jgi:large subunit ribosomal protein L19
MTDIPDIKPGDLVKVHSKIKEGDKERIAPFQGVVIQKRGKDINTTITVRKISAGVGIERIFPLHSPLITKIEIKKRGRVRRAKLTYLRQRKGRRMKIKDATAVSAKISRDTKETTDTSNADSTEEPHTKPEEAAGESAAGQETVETP